MGTKRKIHVSMESIVALSCWSEILVESNDSWSFAQQLVEFTLYGVVWPLAVVFKCFLENAWLEVVAPSAPKIV